MSKVCPACSYEYQTIYYQRRAADEPPDKVTFCPNCPVDTSKLSLNVNIKDDNTISTIQTTVSRRPKTSRQLSLSSNTFSEVGTTTFITVQGMAAQRCYKSILKLDSKPKSIVATKMSIHKSNIRQLVDLYLTSTFKGNAYVPLSSEKIAPFITLDKFNQYASNIDQLSTVNKSVVGYEYLLDNIPGAISTSLRTLYKGQKPTIVISLDNSILELQDKYDDHILSILENVLIRYGTENSIKSFMLASTLNTLYIQSGKAYDWPSAPNEGYTYTWKPDGERFWYVKYGSIWLFSRRLLSGKIAGWNIAKNVHTTITSGPVLDVEVLIGHDPILIDVLIDDSGSPMPAMRSLDTVLSEFNNLTTVDIPIHVRNYFRSEKDLLATKNELQYPTDGVVGIQDGSMTIIKLKDDKSIELELQSNGDLLSSDKVLIAESELQNTYEPGSIVEIRFTKQSGQDTPVIIETLLRTDKLKANDSSVCKDILNTISDTPDIIARRKALLWCNSIRQRLNQVASKIIGKGRVILDIGAGDGQAVSDYSTDPDITYILLEPDLSKCKKMIRRLSEPGKGKSRLFEGAGTIIHVAGLVSTKKLKYAIVNATLKDILMQQHCIRTLQNCVRCCIASFSISYIVPELQQLALSNFNILGCGYMYDSVNNLGTLIDEYGVLMKYQNFNNRHNNSTAMVKWGTDKVYMEKAITINDFKEFFYHRLATNILPIVEGSDSSLLQTISSKVYIISTIKQI
jgi:hypothetical protein